MRRAITLAVTKDGKFSVVTGPEVSAGQQRNAMKNAKPGAGVVRHEVWIEGQRAKVKDFKAEAEAKAEREKAEAEAKAKV